MTVMEINSKIEEYQKDDELTEQQKNARIHVLNSELIRIIANEKIDEKMQRLVELREKVPEIDEFTNAYRNYEDLSGFQYVADPEMAGDNNIKYSIKWEIDEIKNLEKNKILKMAQELDNALGLKNVVYPFNEKNTMSDDGDVSLIFEEKTKEELQKSYTESSLKIQELYKQGVLDFKTNMIATKNFMEIYNKCIRFCIDDVGLSRKMPSVETSEKGRSL